jgi:hypothetical protein
VSDICLGIGSHLSSENNPNHHGHFSQVDYDFSGFQRVIGSDANRRSFYSEVYGPMPLLHRNFLIIFQIPKY